MSYKDGLKILAVLAILLLHCLKGVRSSPIIHRMSKAPQPSKEHDNLKINEKHQINPSKELNISTSNKDVKHNSQNITGANLETETEVDRNETSLLLKMLSKPVGMSKDPSSKLAHLSHGITRETEAFARKTHNDFMLMQDKLAALLSTSSHLGVSSKVKVTKEHEKVNAKNKMPFSRSLELSETSQDVDSNSKCHPRDPKCRKQGNSISENELEEDSFHSRIVDPSESSTNEGDSDRSTCHPKNIDCHINNVKKEASSSKVPISVVGKDNLQDRVDDNIHLHKERGNQDGNKNGFYAFLQYLFGGSDASESAPEETVALEENQRQQRGDMLAGGIDMADNVEGGEDSSACHPRDIKCLKKRNQG